MAASLAGGCSEDPLGDLKAPATNSVAGRQRFIVTLANATPDLTEYRRLLQADPASVASYVQRRRAELGGPELDAALQKVDARIVERWWMSGQLTIEAPAERVTSLRSIAGITAVEPDAPLQ